MIQVAQGRLSKQIASDIGISEMTVKIHRANVMRKMQAGSLPDLARMADKLIDAGALQPAQALSKASPS